MSTKIFVNLPVRDLNRSIEFFTKVGFTPNAQFTDENAAAMVIGDNIVAMLLVEPFFQNFTGKGIADTATTAEVIVALGVDTRERVDELVDNALASGGSPGAFSADDGFMYGRSFSDPDGHLWEVLHMNESALQQPAA